LKLLSFFLSAEKPAAPVRADRKVAADRSRSVRIEVIRLALRDTLARARIPLEWVGFELLSAADRAGPGKFHVRLAVRRWDGWPVQSVVELERALLRRMKLLDTMCHLWVVDISWRFTELAAGASSHDNKSASRPAPKAADREALLDAEHERRYSGRETHPDFSPTQPMMR
jgi:hypothetical protein